MRRVTFSRNLTLSLARTCRCYCKYCAFATHQAHVHPPEWVVDRLDAAARRNVKELLVLTGERPEVNPVVAERLRSWGHDDFTSYVRWACRKALERGLLPHTNIGVADGDDYMRLREVTASQGLMLESVSKRLMETVHAGSPTKHPRVRLDAIEAAGEARIPFTSGILVGIGESEEERMASLEALAELQRRHGHIQEVILQNFVPHPRYYGAEVAEIAAEASELRWAEGRPASGRRVAGGGPRADAIEWPEWAEPVTLAEMKRLVAESRRLMPEVGVQVPPNLSDWWLDLVDAGATDLGGLSANGDHISPEHPFPSPLQVRRRLRPRGYALTERLCVYPQYMNEEWVDRRVLDVLAERYPTFLPRRAAFGSRDGSGNGNGRRALGPGDPVHSALARGRAGDELTRDELAALFAETRPEAVAEIRVAADELRAELAGDVATFVVNRNINFTNVCTVGCAFCGFGQTGRSPDAYEIDPDEFTVRVREAVEFGATEICMQGGIHPDYTLERYGGWLRRAKDVAPDIHLHAYSPMEVHFMCERSGRDPDWVFAYLREQGLGSTPGTAAEVLDDGVRGRISPNKLPAGRWIEIIEASHRAGLRSTSTVMFGHIERPEELAEHMRVVRAVQERTGGITEFVPLSFIPYHTMLGRTHGIEEISAAENLKHTAVFRLALGRTVPNLQASWVKMGLGAATEALSWGVNDLGGTLMEESISRMAGSRHGSRLEPADLIGAARAAGRTPARRSTLYEVLETY
ncbi:MAG: 7,8-didemethyl-8-hydroxy-5-deazariboflavin synthase subunit CofH [Acidobacteria bacterium]|nr:MAG: 7,8-didemethyl-8-hydroxy-5-deazariboflavin synthase subunit CofH [Acidobacteriota bacterium]